MARMPGRNTPPTHGPDLGVVSADLRHDIERSGYYPGLVIDIVAEALAGQEVVAHLVHQETTFDQTEVLRHITVLALTANQLVVVHVDDHQDELVRGDAPIGADEPVVTATSESVPLSGVRGVMLTHVVPKAASYRPGSLGRALTLGVSWGAVSRVDLLPATCGDPNCEADHGYDGTLTADDIQLRVSADADGADALGRARAFARALSAAISR